MATATKKSGTRSTSTSSKTSAKKKSGGRKPSSEQTCWPGYEPTPGKAAGEKGSCKPKAKQTKSEKRGDQKAAAASKSGGKR